jgi:metal transporter CNNM
VHQEFTGGTLGLITSTLFILILGEISPQAACSRHGLYVGYHAIPLVKVILFLFYPVAKPIAMILDCVLGKELATIYSSAEMMKLLAIHVAEDALDHDVAKTMGGALRYKDMSVSSVMTPLANTFMLNIDEKLNFETIARIFKTGFSRIPVYEVTKNNVVGLLFVKDLIFIDPGDENRVREFVEIMGRSFHVFWPDDKLGDALKELKRGKSHMALVRGVSNEKSETDPYYEIKGIITLEDIIEEIIGTFSTL